MLERQYVQDTLDGFAKEVIKQSKVNFGEKNASGKGTRSMEHDVKAFNQSFQMEISMESHMIFQDKGVSGIITKYDTPFSYKDHPTPYKAGAGVIPPPSAFDRWSIRRGLAPRNLAGQFLSRKSLQFALSVHIYKHGIKPTKFFTKAFEDEFKNLPDDLVDSYALEVEDLMKATLNSTDAE